MSPPVQQNMVGPISADTMERLVKEALTAGLQSRVIPRRHPGSILGIVIGGLLCLSGVVLALLGISGSLDWIVEAGSLKSKLSNATPGIAISMMGMIVLWRYRPAITYKIEVNPIVIRIKGDEMEFRGPRVRSEGTASSPATGR